MKRNVVTVIAAAVLCFGMAADAQTRSAMKTTWEYKVVDPPTVRDVLERLLNQVGADGWELVTVPTEC